MSVNLKLSLLFLLSAGYDAGLNSMDSSAGQVSKAARIPVKRRCPAAHTSALSGTVALLSGTVAFQSIPTPPALKAELKAARKIARALGEPFNASMFIAKREHRLLNEAAAAAKATAESSAAVSPTSDRAERAAKRARLVAAEREAAMRGLLDDTSSNT